MFVWHGGNVRGNYGNTYVRVSIRGHMGHTGVCGKTFLWIRKHGKSFQSAKSGAGEQFLMLLLCMANICPKVLFTDTGMRGITVLRYNHAGSETASCKGVVFMINPQTKNLEFRGFNSSRLLILRGEIPMSIRNFPRLSL